MFRQYHTITLSKIVKKKLKNPPFYSSLPSVQFFNSFPATNLIAITTFLYILLGLLAYTNKYEDKVIFSSIYTNG